jgi:hypothetical protein
MIAFESYWVVCALALLLPATSDCALAGKPEHAAEFLGDRAIKVLVAVDRVEVFRIAPLWEKKKDQDANFVGYPLQATAKDQGKDYAVRLAGILKDDGSYDWGIAKACEFGPGVGYRIWSGKDSIVVLICFQCNEIGVIPDESKPTILNAHSADPARPALLKLARQAFPDDQILRLLKD